MHDDSSKRPGRWLIGWFQQLPITGALLCIMIGLSMTAHAYQLAYPDDASNVFRHLGAASTLVFPYRESLGLGSPHGFFDLWEGELWRVVVSAFHHGDLLHLLMNGVTLAFFGYLLEPRMGRIRFLMFTLIAGTASLVPELLNGNEAVGISGALCAMLGLLIVMRRSDDEVAAYFSDGVVLASLAMLVGFVVLTRLEMMRIANLAHFAGLGYGLLAGEVFYGRWRTRVTKWAFYSGHLILIPAGYFVMHPIWDGHYYWYQAVMADNGSERREHFEAAVRLDPGLSEPWHAMASYLLSDGDPHAAWRAILDGLSYNRSDKRGAALSRELWKEFRSSEDRQKALQTLNEVFGEEAGAWKQRLRLAAPAIAEGRRAPPPELLDRFRLDQSIQLPATIDGSEESQIRSLDAPAIDPNHPESAAVGAAT